ncbi:MAG: enoyl-CoA hydratase/isomerase family protein [Microthrixaceae bacterium]
MAETSSADRPLDEQVRLEIVDQVAWITIDRPEKGNALSPPCRDRIRDLINDLNGAYTARAIVLTATGHKLFCPGADLSHRVPAERPEGVPSQAVGDARRMMLEGQYTLFPAILDSELPIIAAVNGTAAGMGAHLAFACDLVIAAEGTKFIEVFSRRGLVVDALGAYLLPRTIGLHKAKELILFADDLPVAEAERLGLVNKVVPRTSWPRPPPNGPDGWPLGPPRRSACRSGC